MNTTYLLSRSHLYHFGLILIKMKQELKNKLHIQFWLHFNYPHERTNGVRGVFADKNKIKQNKRKIK